MAHIMVALNQARAVPQLSSLTPLKLIYLKKNKIAVGRVAFATVEGACFLKDKCLIIPIVVENEPMWLLIANARQGRDESKFPTGSKLGIKEPFCFQLGKEKGGLGVRTTLSIEFLGMEDGDNPSELSLKGSAAFDLGDVLTASLYFSECINKLPGGECGEALCRRAEAYLELDMIDQAYDDALKALTIDPTHVMGMLCKGKALAASQEHEQALQVLQLALGHSSSNENYGAIEEAVEKCELSLKRSRDGVYDLSEFLLGGLKPELAPTCTDYVGPVEAFMTSDGRGRGLCVTKDVQVGELLLVSNPIALLSGGSMSDLHMKVMEKCVASSRAYLQLQALTNTRVVPSMVTFIPNSGIPPGSASAKRIIDPDTILATLIRSMFSHYLGAVVAWTGLWGLPALLNHSCTPTVSMVKVGDVMFVRAASDIKAGKEMTISYTDPLASGFGFRSERLLKNYGFVCKCSRCKLEGKLQRRRANGIPATYTDRVSKNVATVGDCMVFSQELWVTMVKQGIPLEQRTVIMGGFVDVYEALGACEPEELAHLAFQTGRGSLFALARVLRYVSEARRQANEERFHRLVTIAHTMLVSCFGDLDMQLFWDLALKWFCGEAPGYIQGASIN